MKIESLGRNIVPSLACNKVNICLKDSGQVLELFSCQLYQAQPVCSHLGFTVLNLLLCRRRGTTSSGEVQSMLFTALSPRDQKSFVPLRSPPHYIYYFQRNPIALIYMLKIKLREFAVYIDPSVNHASLTAFCLHILVRNMTNWCITVILEWSQISIAERFKLYVHWTFALVLSLICFLQV